MTLAIMLLAAGHGTRMNSKYQKVLHDVGGKPMVQHVFEATAAAADLKPVIVVGEGQTGIPDLLGDRATYLVQKERLGTGHATMVGRELLACKSTQVLVTYGDMPLLRAETITRLAEAQRQKDAVVALLAADGDVSSTFGRVVRDENGRIIEIIEVANARQRPNAGELLAIREQNAGVYCFDAAWLWANIDKLPLRQARTGQEYYLTDMIEMAVQQGKGVAAIWSRDPDEALGAGTRAEMVAVEKAFRRRANSKWLNAGVTLIDPESIFIDQDVTIGQDTIIWPNTYLQGKTIIGEECVVGPNAILRDVEMGAGCVAEQVVLERQTIPDQTHVPPFSHRRGDL